MSCWFPSQAQAYIRSLPRMPKIPFSQLYPRATPMALDLLEKLLDFDPASRITVEQALGHDYLAAYHEEDDEPVHEQMFDFAFERVDKIDDMKKLIAQEVMSFKATKEQQGYDPTQQAQLQQQQQLLQPQNGANGNASRGGASLSAADRNATTAAAKNIPRQQIQEEPAMADDLVAHGSMMEVDEDLERELSGQAVMA